MTYTPTQARRLPPAGGSPRDVAESINNIFAGRLGLVGEFTLTAGATTTTVTDNRVGSNSNVAYSPRTANASAEIGAGTIYIGTYANGSFIVTHANNAQTDRTFRYTVTA